ncbi:MAG: hypothetical protein ABL966_12405 [Acidimicrobiales bacterium]
MRTRALFVGLVSTLVLTAVMGACASSSDEGAGDGGPSDPGLSDEAQALADAWSETLQDDEDGFGVEPADADCMGTAIMAELGMEVFDDAGVTPSDIGGGEDNNSPGELLGDGVISTEQADAVIDAWEADCIDVTELLSTSAGEEFGLDAEGQACFADGLAEDDLARSLLRPSFTSGTDDPDEAVLTDVLAVIESCSGDEASPLVTSIAESLAADGVMTDEQAACIAQAVVDDLGAARLTELTAGGDFEDADPAAQQEITGALLDAAGSCDVPLSAFGG